MKSKLMKTFGQFLLACSMASPSSAGELLEYYYGDSIAVGYGKDSPGSRRVGASPSEVLGYLERDLKNNPEKFKGQTINVSTGVSNNPSDFKSIERQLSLLQKSGAKVNVLGAAQGRYDKENARLASLSSSYGANFRGGFKPGRDGVHPASYASYDTGAKPQKPKSETKPKIAATPRAIAPAVLPSKPRVLSKLKGVEGTGAGKDFVAKKWTDTEKSRYQTYGGK